MPNLEHAVEKGQRPPVGADHRKLLIEHLAILVVRQHRRKQAELKNNDEEVLNYLHTSEGGKPVDAKCASVIT